MKFISKKFLIFTVRPIIVMMVVSLSVGAVAGAIAGFYASTYVFSEFVSYSQSAIPHILSQESGADKETDDKAGGLIIGSKEETNIVAAVEKVSPSVVSIVVSKYVTQYYGTPKQISPDFFDDPFFKEFFPEQSAPESQEPQEEKEKQQVGGGTGFLISSQDGLILTNKHVVSDEGSEYMVVTNNGDEYKAQVLASDPFNDIAIIKVEAVDLPEVELGDSDELQMGQTVIAIGNALGEYRNTVTKGVISGVGRRVVAGDTSGRSEVLENVIQTDAAINFGNSGGPLINARGEVIGINTAISSQGQLIGFAIPINQAKYAIESVKKYGKIIRPFLGVRYILINKEIAKKNNLSIDYGALIVRGSQPGDLAIIPGSPADKADLEENDIILEVDEVRITEKRSLAKEIQKYKPGDEMELKILHKGEEKTVKVVLEEYEG